MAVPYMIQISVALLSVFFIHLAIKYFIKPYLQVKAYAKLLKANYKTYEYPFGMGISYMLRLKSDLRQYGDSGYTRRHLYPQYQVTIMSFAGKPFITFIDPQLLKQFYQKSAEGCYEKDEGIMLKQLHNVAKTGVLLSQGEQYKTKKKIMSQIFNHQFIKSKINDIIRISRETIDTQSQKHEKNGFVNLNLLHMFQKIFGRVVIKCFFGNIQLGTIKGQDPSQFVHQLLTSLARRSFSISSAILGQAFFKLRLRQLDRDIQDNSKIFRNYARNIIEKQVQIIGKEKDKDVYRYGGMIELLIKQGKLRKSCTPEEMISQGLYSYEELIDEMCMFFVAGTDTTAVSYIQIVYKLAKNPIYLQRVRAQIKNVIGNDLANITYEKLKQMKQLENVQKEVLRMSSPLLNTIFRKVTKDHYIGKIPMKKGTLAYPQLVANHYKQCYYPDPHTFNPDRWNKIDTNPEPFTFLPFSFGQRSCIGQHLSLIEGKIAVITFLLSFKEIMLEKENYRIKHQPLSCPEEMITRLTRA